jgi:hypothetical protein
MPVNEPMMRNFKRQYGSAKGKEYYYRMENKMKSMHKRAKGSNKATLKHKLNKIFNS